MKESKSKSSGTKNQNAQWWCMDTETENIGKSINIYIRTDVGMSTIGDTFSASLNRRMGYVMDEYERMFIGTIVGGVIGGILLDPIGAVVGGLFGAVIALNRGKPT